MTCSEKACPFIKICSYYNFLNDNKENCKYEKDTYNKLERLGWTDDFRWHECKEKLPPLNKNVLVKGSHNVCFVGCFAARFQSKYDEFYFYVGNRKLMPKPRKLAKGVAWKYID